LNRTRPSAVSDARFSLAYIHSCAENLVNQLLWVLYGLQVFSLSMSRRHLHRSMP